MSKKLDFSNISMIGRFAYAVMCAERYALAKYPEKDWRPLFSWMWQGTSDYFDEWYYRFMGILPGPFSLRATIPSASAFYSTSYDRKGLLQKQLGMLLGFSEKTAEVRIAQYENDARAPKEDLMKQMAQVLDVRPEAIRVPDIDTYVGLAHTLFTLEDRYGFKPGEIDGELCIRLDKYHREFHAMFALLQIWAEKAKKLSDEEITKED